MSKKTEETFSKANPAEAVLSYVEKVSINPLREEGIAHLDICIKFFHPPVSIILFEALVEKGLQVIIFNKDGTLVNNIKLKDLEKINKVTKHDSMFLSFSERKIFNKNTIVSCFVPMDVGYRIFFFYPGNKSNGPASREFPILPIH